MRFYSGFSLKNDQHFFGSFLQKGDYTVSGFSYGAIKAALFAADTDERIDTLQLFSPAFFQTKKESFRRLQMSGYLKDPREYIRLFINNCFAPCPDGTVEKREDSEEELRELLYFEWTEDLMESIRSKGIRIEVYLGLEDRIIDVAGARKFFIPFATVTSMKNCNHFLQECQ